MNGLMQDFPLTIHHLLWRAERLFPEREVVSRDPEGLRRSTYGALARRVRKLAGALAAAGVRRGDRVATFAANTSRHLELYFAVPCIGAVLHTINVRFSPDQVAFTAGHAADRFLFFDASVAHLLEPAAGRLGTVERFVRMGPGESPVEAIDYEELVERAEPVTEWPRLDERAAAGLCYTSGTTGRPRGVLYSHRSTLLHAFGIATGSAFGYREDDVALTVVPMFHAMAWGQPYAAAMAGCKQVFPGPFPGPATLLELMEAERVTVSAAVPTVWIGVLEELERRAYDLSSVRLLAAGGAAVPATLVEAFHRRHGITVLPSWGMTEISPVGSLGHLKSALAGAPAERRYEMLSTAGLAIPGIELRIVDPLGAELPWDGRALGELQVRGPWVASAYYPGEHAGASFAGEWLRTGDVATVDEWGYVRIVDRTKDLVKSGGEWISTVELERALMSHPAVFEAAVIGVADARWGERPLAFVALRAGASATGQELLGHLASRFPRWWLPEEVRFVPEVPKTSVGKFDKRALRERYGGRGEGGARPGERPASLEE